MHPHTTALLGTTSRHPLPILDESASMLLWGSLYGACFHRVPPLPKVTSAPVFHVACVHVSKARSRTLYRGASSASSSARPPPRCCLQGLASIATATSKCGDA